MRESDVNSAAAIATVILDENARRLVEDCFSVAPTPGMCFVTDEEKLCSVDEQPGCYTQPSYQLPPSCRIELLAEMVRVAADCRRNYGGDADPVRSILRALREVCSDATNDELRIAVSAARAELYLKVIRLDGWVRSGITAEIETWLEVAKGQIFDLEQACLNLEDEQVGRTT